VSYKNLVGYKFAALLMVLALIIPILAACDMTTSSTNPSSTNLSTAPTPTSISNSGGEDVFALEHNQRVPFESQWARQLASPFQYPGNGQNGGGNCGPASLTMVLHFYGKSVTFEQVVAAVRADCTTGPCTEWTSFESLDSQKLLQQNGLDLVRNSGQIVNMGSFADIKAQIDQNHPVIMLVNNSYGRTALYGNLPGMVVKDHIVVVTGYRAGESGVVQTIFINDSLAIIKSSTPTPTTSAYLGTTIGKWVADDREEFGKDFALTSTQFQIAVQSCSQSWFGAAVVQTAKIELDIDSTSPEGVKFVAPENGFYEITIVGGASIPQSGDNSQQTLIINWAQMKRTPRLLRQLWQTKVLA